MSSANVQRLTAIAAAYQRHLDTFEPCPDCGRLVDPNRVSAISLPKVDAAGVPVLDREGKQATTIVRLRTHVFPPTQMDLTGFTEVDCAHGLPAHPDKERTAQRARRGGSWVRAKYAQPDGKCIVDRTGETPDDLTTPRVA